MNSNAKATRAFITGVSGGMGGAIARLLLSRGWEVWGTARSAEAWSSLATDSRFHGVVLDLNDRAGALAAFASSGREADGFDLVINNAGYGVFCPLVELAPDELERQLAAMISTTAALAKAQVELLAARPRGTLVNVSSLAVEFPLPFMAGYNMAKSALSALSESLMMECAGTNVVVIDFRPGDIKTGFNQVMADRASKAMAGSSQPNLDRTWRTLEKNIAQAPSPEFAARSLLRAIERDRAGIVRCGGVFQARLAPVLIRLIPDRLARWVRWRYFGLKSGG